MAEDYYPSKLKVWRPSNYKKLMISSEIMVKLKIGNTGYPNVREKFGTN